MKFINELIKMKFVLILLLLIGICGASDYGDINIRQGSNLSYVDGGGTAQTFDMASTPAMGNAWGYNYSDTEYEPVTLGDPTTVTVGELSLTNPKTWLIDYKVHSTIPGCYDTMLEALTAASDDASDFSNCRISLIPGNYSMNHAWEINVTSDDVFHQMIVQGNGARLSCSEGGILLNRTKIGSTVGNIYIRDISLVGPGYAAGFDGIAISPNAANVERPQLENVKVYYFNTGINLTLSGNLQPYCAMLRSCVVRSCNVGYKIDGCHNSLLFCEGMYTSVGSDSVGLWIGGAASTDGRHMIYRYDAGNADTGILTHTAAGGSIIENVYYEGTGVGINISASKSPDVVIAPPTWDCDIEIGRSCAPTASARVIGTGTYSVGDSSPNFILGPSAYDVWIENFGGYRPLNITNNSPYYCFTQRIMSTTSAPTSPCNEGDISLNRGPGAGEAAFWLGQGGSTWIAGPTIPV